MKKRSFDLHKFLYYIIAILPLILVKQISVLGGNVLPLLIIALEVCLICKKILDNNGQKINIIKKYTIDKLICGFIFFFALWKIFSFLMGIFSSEMLDMEFYTTILVVTALYLLMDFQMDENSWFLKVVTIGGTIGSGMIFLTNIKESKVITIIDGLTVSNDGIKSYLLMVVIFAIVNYIMIEEHMKWEQLWIVPIALNMFVLLLHQSHISNWLIVFVLLVIASLFRPRATLIKKVGILIFLFMFLWANMSLIINYTQWFQVEAVYSLEASVYMELVLALGGLLFFHFWDRLPKDADLHKVSMVKMQEYFRMVTCILGFVFLIFIAGGEAWQALPDTGLQGFVKVLALPLSKELVAGSSTIFTWIVEMGIVMVILFLLWFYQIGKRLLKKCGIDQEKNNIFLLIYILFLVEIFIWEVPCNVLIVYMFIISMGNIQPMRRKVELDENSGGGKE